MDAKRIIPILQVQAGQCGGAPPEQAAGRLELAGADELLFAADAGTDWIGAVAAALFIPFAVERAYRTLAELEEVVAAGADKLVLAADAIGLRLLAPAVRRFGRARLTLAVDVVRTGDGLWLATAPDSGEGREALAWMMELGLLGAGEILLRADPGPGAGELFMRAAQLAKPILCRCADPLAAGAEALLHGADGVVYSDPITPAECKAALDGQGLALRR
jgi:imidazole glycerol phosphate synthase subunit HisF